MNKKKKKKNNEVENNANEVLIDLLTNEEYSEDVEQDDFKIKSCEVLFIKDKSFVIDFDGCGINIKTQGIIDKDLVPSFIDVKYKSNIGKSDFECHLIFDFTK